MTALTAAFAVDDPWLRDLGVHPAWVAVVVFAARYGPRGLFASIAFAWGPLIAAGLAWDRPLYELEARLRSSLDLVALATALLVAWVAMSHVGRRAALAARIDDAETRERSAIATLDALREGLTYLRGRCDRLDASITFWRTIARRIDGADRDDAALAALDLAMARCGAAAGLVRQRRGTQFVPVAWRGIWPEAAHRSHDLSEDRTALTATAARRPVIAADDDVAAERDSDVAAPMLGDGGDVVGVVALRGVGHDSLRSADLRDLALIAEWLAPALAPPVARPQLRAVNISEGARS